MKRLHLLVPVMAGLVVVLTYFLVQGTTPDAPQHERAHALQAVILYNASLQRDVLRARAGLSRSYDSVVGSVDDLLSATASLERVRVAADAETQAEIDSRIKAVTAAVRAQEALVETFKSDNALLRNSMAYFNHLADRLAAAKSNADVSAEIGTLTAAMLRFVNQPQSDAGDDVIASLDRLALLPIDSTFQNDVRSLMSHGRLVVRMLPAVDVLVAELQAAPTAGQVRALQDVYLEAHGRAAARADMYLALLYAAALVLVGYVAYLFIRLRANARTLSKRLEFEAMIASISTEFVKLPRDRLQAGLASALVRLAAQSGIERADIVVDHSGDYTALASSPNSPSPDLVRELVARLALDGCERQGCIHAPDIGALPDSPEKTALQARGVRSWLCVPMQVAGGQIGFLTLEATARNMHWFDDDIALLRTAAEIFANAIARERNEGERETLQTRLNQSQRLEAIGTLAGGIAHEFNNILGAMQGYGEMALSALKEPRPRHHVEQFLKAGARAEHIVEQLLAFGRRRHRSVRPIKAAPVLREAVGLVRASQPSTLSVCTRFVADDALIVADATELQQVVMNLATNAAQAMNHCGVILLALDAIENGVARELSHGRLPPGRWLRLAVADTGHGIDPATMEHIFEPFFTTKPAGKGTGLGLSTVHGIVTGLCGAIDVESAEGKGTRFEIYLPRAEGVTAAFETTDLSARRGHGETVLIVDDEKSLVLLSEEILAALGYEPVGFDRSAAAFRAFRADPKRFDLMLADEIMPDMTGTELAGAVHNIRPDLPIVLMTGHGMLPRSDRLQNSGIREVLSKPLLSHRVAECLARQLPED